MASIFLLPEETELARLETAQAELEDQVASAELALETTKSEMMRFQQRYYAIVGCLYAQLDDLEAQLAEIRARQSPKDGILAARANSARQQARRSSEEAELAEAQARPAAEIDPGLKLAYRQAVKLMHPDLALSDHERQRRTRVMTSLNLAYERGDLQEIKRLMTEFGQDPEAIVGEDIASRIVRAMRWIALLRRRLADLGRELEAYQQTDGFQLRQTIEASEAVGGDPMGDLARQLGREICRREADLKALRVRSAANVEPPAHRAPTAAPLST